MPRRFSTPRLIVVGFLALIAPGTVLLKLPVSTEHGISWIDAMFVSVSAGSVTGLTTVDFPATFTTFGAVVVMLLVQLGGSESPRRKEQSDKHFSISARRFAAC